MIQKDITSWKEVAQYLKDMSSKKNCKKNTVTVPAKNLRHPEKARFDEANLMSLTKGAETVYRDGNDECSLQVRYYKDGNATPMNSKNYDQPVYHVQVDRHNPTEGIDQAIAHLFHDLMGVKLPWEH